MVMPVGNITLVCQECGWKKSYFLSSDVVVGIPKTCPKCGKSELKMERDSSWSSKVCSSIHELLKK